jgi:hypothetical protein
MLGSMDRLVAPLTFQARVTLPPPLGRPLGVAVKLSILGRVRSGQAESRSSPATHAACANVLEMGFIGMLLH